MNTFNFGQAFDNINAIWKEHALHQSQMREQYQKQSMEAHRQSTEYALADKLLCIAHGPNRRYFSKVIITDTTWRR